MKSEALSVAENYYRKVKSLDYYAEWCWTSAAVTATIVNEQDE